MANRFVIKIKGLFSTKFKTFLKKFRKFNGYDQLDRKMLNYINYENGYYIECGANDGVNQSNTWYLEKKLGWKGILIEPVDKAFSQLKNNRSSKNVFINKALKSFSYSKNFTILKLNPKDTLSTRSTPDDVKDRIDIKVKVDNLNSVLKKSKAPKIIDFFSLDVEGDELEVLKGIDFKIFKFKYILIETFQPKKIRVYLKRYRYKCVKKISLRNDYLFKIQ